MSVAKEVMQGQGVFLTGELRSVFAGRSYTDRDGNERTPYKVKVLAGDSMITVEYSDEGRAKEALRGVEVGGTVTLPVWVDGPWNAETRKRESVYFRGK